MRELDDIQKDLQRCDFDVLNLLIKRLGYVTELTQYKKEHGLPVLHLEKKQLKQILAEINNQMYSEELSGIFKEISKESRHVQSKCLFDYNIAIIGFMGAGKSTVSGYLKKMLDMNEVDIDSMIVKEQKMPIKDIFKKYGEAYFRNLESNAVIRLQNCHQTLISCGGGVVMRKENVTNLKKGSRIVLLTARPETILERVKVSGERPILNGNMNVAFIKELMDKRASHYEKAADVILETDHKTVQQICEELIRSLIELDKKQIKA